MCKLQNKYNLAPDASPHLCPELQFSSYVNQKGDGGMGGMGMVVEVAAELGLTLVFVKVPEAEKGEILAAFAAHKNEVTAGYTAAAELA